MSDLKELQDQLIKRLPEAIANSAMKSLSDTMVIVSWAIAQLLAGENPTDEEVASIVSMTYEGVVEASKREGISQSQLADETWRKIRSVSLTAHMMDSPVLKEYLRKVSIAKAREGGK